ncbi:hypothetical protein ACO0RG_003891 [Hanseniaspora osmophila]
MPSQGMQGNGNINPNSILTQVSGDSQFLKANLSSAVGKNGKVDPYSSPSDPVYPPSKYSSKRHQSQTNTASSSSMISHHSVNDHSINNSGDHVSQSHLNNNNNIYVDPNAKYYFDVRTYDRNVDSLIIHLNIEEHHYYITRDQLLSLPESLLLCLFPNGVFMDRLGDVIHTLTEEDEVYVFNFSYECFEYIMEVYSQATYDMSHYPLSKMLELYGDPVAVAAAATASNNHGHHGASGFFSQLAHHASASASSLTSSQKTAAQAAANSEASFLQKNPSIIVLREDLDYYCIPLSIKIEPSNHEVLDVFMRSVKIAAGGYLRDQMSIFDGLYCSNKVEINKETGEKKLGVAEQHLMDMLCTSGLPLNSTWGNRSQEHDKTVISSLSLIRLQNETTSEFRDKVAKSYTKHLEEDKVKIEQLKVLQHQQQQQQQQQQQMQLSPQISRDSLADNLNSPHSHSATPHNNHLNSASGNELTPTSSRKSRWSTKLSSVRSRSHSRNASKHRSESSNNIEAQISKVGPKSRHLYDYAPKPEINSKLLLFWKKPARKCWWGNLECVLDIELPFEVEYHKDEKDGQVTILKVKGPGYTKLSLPVRLHIRRVWTLEVSIVGV